MKNNTKTATAQNHAKLFAFIVKSTLEELGEGSILSLKNGVKKYGNQRGRRMSHRAKIDNRELNYLNYLLYGEWSVDSDKFESEFSTEESDTSMSVYKCPWYYEWFVSNMVNFGSIYCDVVDEALIEGFNPDLKFELSEHRTRGDGKCHFSFINANLTPEDLKEIQRLKELMGNSAKKSWDYHIGHLYKIMKKQLVEDFQQRGSLSIDKALNLYSNEYGEDAYNKILEYENVDFDSVEDYISIFPNIHK